jgi:polysaccharide chain length determinant protein (PEP-CTERM system associated)
VAKVEDRLPSISDQIKSRSRLERIIRDFDLYPKERATQVLEDVVQRMRDDIEIKLDRNESFRVSYVSDNPQTAQKVTARLASLSIEENLLDREKLAEGANAFLASQLEDAKRRLIDHERKLEEYRRRYAGQLPTQLQSNLQVIQNAQLQLQAVNESMNRARERRLLIERQIADAEAAPAGVPVQIPGANPGESIPMSPAQQLEAARATLERYKTRYKPDHPDVRALERTIKELQQKVDEEAQKPVTTPDPAKAVSPTEALRQARLRDLQTQLEVIDHQIAAHQTEEATLKRTIAEYQAKVDAVPTRESELIELTRDYSTLQTAYTSLLAKREESKLAVDLERRQVGEQFKILDVASLPERPFNKLQRIAVAVVGGMLGLFLGVGLAVLYEYRDCTFKTEEELARVLSLPVLALVPSLDSPRHRRSWRRRLVASVVFVVVAGSAAALVAWGWQP